MNIVALERANPAYLNHNEIWSDDVLNRRACAAQFSTILEHSTGPLVVSVSSPFGTGKTFFAERWKQQLRDEGKSAISFNAWECDFSEDPLIAFIGQFYEEIEALGLSVKTTKKLRDKFLSAAKTGLSIGLRIGMRAAIGAAVFHATDEDVNSEAEAALTKGAEEAEKYVLGRIQSFAQERAERDVFRAQMGEWRNAINFSKKRYQGAIGQCSDQKIYILIDELDRCRPEYSIKLLESIKHLFDVEGFVFIIFVDEDQLQKHTEKLFGERPDGEAFMKKFIDYRLSIPTPSYQQFSEFLMNKSSFKGALIKPNMPGGSEKDVIDNFAFFSEKFNLSLRTQWRVFRNIEMTASLYTSRHISPLIFLACLKEHDLDSWTHFCRVLIAPEKALEKIDYIEFKDNFNSFSTEQPEEQILEIYLYTRIFFDEAKFAPHDMDRVTQEAKTFFKRIFDSEATDPKRRDEAREMRDQIELVTQFEVR